MGSQIYRGISVAALALLAACASPLEEVPKLSEVDVADPAPGAELRETSDAQTPVFRPGLLGAVFGRGNRDASGAQGADAMTPGPTEVDPNAAPVAETASLDAAEANTPETNTPDTVAASADTPQSAQPRRGLFGLFARATPAAEAAATPNPSTPAEDTAQQTAPATTTEGAAQPARRGLFGGGRRAQSSAIEPDVEPGAPLKFGAVGRVCGLSRRDRGTQVSVFPERGRGAYQLFDSAPGSIVARPYYITGFADGCARQVTAANVVFGAPSMHERLRYGLPADTLPSSRTDEAYKRLKSRICRVSRSAPCGENIDRLESNTVFVTMYASFSGNQTWSNLLLHDGALYANDIKQRP